MIVAYSCNINIYSVVWSQRVKDNSFILETIPDENKAMRVAAPISTVAGMLPPTKEWPPNVVNMVSYSALILCIKHYWWKIYFNLYHLVAALRYWFIADDTDFRFQTGGVGYVPIPSSTR